MGRQSKRRPRREQKAATSTCRPQPSHPLLDATRPGRPERPGNPPLPQPPPPHRYRPGPLDGAHAVVEEENHGVIDAEMLVLLQERNQFGEEGLAGAGTMGSTVRLSLKEYGIVRLLRYAV